MLYNNNNKNMEPHIKPTLLLSSEISRTASVTPNTAADTHQSLFRAPLQTLFDYLM